MIWSYRYFRSFTGLQGGPLKQRLRRLSLSFHGNPGAHKKTTTSRPKHDGVFQVKGISRFFFPEINNNILRFSEKTYKHGGISLFWRVAPASALEPRHPTRLLG